MEKSSSDAKNVAKPRRRSFFAIHASVGAEEWFLRGSNLYDV